MEANEAQELRETAEKAEGREMRPVAFTMSLLAMLVAIATVMGHRVHTDAVLKQNETTDQWNLYQAKKIRANDTQLTLTMLDTLAIKHEDEAAKARDEYRKHIDKWTDELKQQQDAAEAMEGEVTRDERKAGFFDIAEAMLEIGLVVTSITLLTRSRGYWFGGLVFGLLGIVAALWGLVL